MFIALDMDTNPNSWPRNFERDLGTIFIRKLAAWTNLRVLRSGIEVSFFLSI